MIISYHHVIMSTISVPIPTHLETFIERTVRRGIAPNKAEVVRQALTRYAEDQAVEAVLRAQQEIRDGKELRGDVRDLLKKIV